MRIGLILFSLVVAVHSQGANYNKDSAYNTQQYRGGKTRNPDITAANIDSGIRRNFDKNEQVPKLPGVPEQGNANERNKKVLDGASSMYPPETPYFVAIVKQLTGCEDPPEKIRRDLSADKIVFEFGKEFSKTILPALKKCAGANVPAISAHLNAKCEDLTECQQILQAQGFPVCDELLSAVTSSRSANGSKREMRRLQTDIMKKCDELEPQMQNMNIATDKPIAMLKLATFKQLVNVLAAISESNEL